MFGCAIFFVLYSIIFLLYLKLQIPKNFIFFEIMFRLFKKSESKLKKNYIEFK